MKAVIPAAGLGTRFLPYTRSQPKEMLPVVDKPAIQYVVEEAIASGITEILIVTGRGKRAIEDHFDRNLELEQHLRAQSLEQSGTGVEEILSAASIFYVRQKEPLGLGHAVSMAEKYVGDEAFSVLLGDDLTFDTVPCQRRLVEAQARTGGSVIAVQQVPRGLMGRYGMVEGKEVAEGLIRVERIVEKPSPSEVTSTLATLGRYVLTPSVFSHIKATKPDGRGEVQLTNALAHMLEREDVHAVVFNGRRFDVGDRIGWLAANIALALERKELREEVLRMIADFQASAPPH